MQRIILPMPAKLAIALGFAILCGCSHKNETSAEAKQIAALTLQISALNAKIDALTTNLVRVEGSLNFEIKADTAEIGGKVDKLKADQSLGLTAMAEYVKIQTEGVQKSIGNIDKPLKSKDYDARFEYVDETLKSIFDQTHDIAVEQIEQDRRLDTIQIKLHAY